MSAEWTTCREDCMHEGPFRVGYGDQWDEYDSRTRAWEAHVLRGFTVGQSILQARHHGPLCNEQWNERGHGWHDLAIHRCTRELCHEGPHVDGLLPAESAR